MVEKDKILLLTYYWPPAGGPGVQRMVKFAKYFPENNFIPFVLTAKNADYPVLDKSLHKEIEFIDKVFKAWILEPFGLFKRFMGLKKGDSFDASTHFSKNKVSRKKQFSDWVRANLFIPDAKMLWIPVAFFKALYVIKKYNIKYLLTTSPPYTTAVVGLLLKFFMPRLKWVMDCRDPWGVYLDKEAQSKIADRINRSLEKKCLKRSDRITLAWPGIENRLFEDTNIDISHKSHWIPNGHEFESEFSTNTNQKNKRFTITYSGSFYSRRYPEKFVDAVGKIFEQEQKLKELILFRIIGRIDPDVLEKLNNVWGKDNVEYLSYMPHNQLVGQLKKTDALWLAMDDLPEAKLIIGGKTYEYIGLQKPIIACLPENSQSEKLLKETATGCRVDPENVSELKAMLKEWINKWQKGEEIISPNTSIISRYHRRSITSRLSKLIREIN